MKRREGSKNGKNGGSGLRKMDKMDHRTKDGVGPMFKRTRVWKRGRTIQKRKTGWA